MDKLITPVVFTDEQGQHQVMTEDGNIIKCTMTCVTDEIGNPPMALVKMFVKLATDKEHARELVKQQWQIM